MIFITGASGKTGQAIIKALHTRGIAIRALVRREAQQETLLKLGAQEVVVGDMREKHVLAKAMKDVNAIYHICPNMAPDEIAIAKQIINIAVEAKITHFVYHSVLHPQTERMAHHWHKLRVEEYLFESGLPYTILQPAAYMQNVLANWSHIVEKGVYQIPYAVETRVSMVDLLDVATVAATVLSEGNKHHGAIYELVGPDKLNQVEIAHSLSQVLGRPVQAKAIPREVWAQQAQAAGLSGYALETLLKMFIYYEQFGFCGNSNVLTWLLGQKPTPFKKFIERERVAF